MTDRLTQPSPEADRKREYFRSVLDTFIRISDFHTLEGMQKAMPFTFAQPGSTWAVPEGGEEIIESVWDKKIENGFKKWATDETPSRVRLAEYKLQRDENGNDTLVIVGDPSVSYKQSDSSMSPEYRAYVEKLPEKERSRAMPDALAVSTVVFAKDKNGDMHMGITRRVAGDYKRGGGHVMTGGYMTIYDPKTEKGDRHPIEAALRETQEEIGVAPTEISDMACLGITYNPSKPHPDILFAVDSSLTVEEILSPDRQEKRKKSDRENDLFFIPATKEALERWLVVPSHAYVTPALDLIIRAGKMLCKDWNDERGNPIDPDEWEREMISYLGWQYADIESPMARRFEEQDTKYFGGMVDASDKKSVY